MLIRACAILAILAAVPCWSQVEASAEGGFEPDEDTRMLTPPAVSGATLPLDLEPGQRSNYLSGGVTFNAAYIGNVQPGETAASINDKSYSIWPVLTLDQRNPRALRSVTYSSGFTFYQRTSTLDSVNQNMDARVEYGISPRLNVSLRDTFRQNSNIYNQPLLASGAADTPDSALVIPFAEELKNEVSGIFTYQYSRYAMLGGKAAYELLNFPNLAAGSGLSNSRAESGLGFLSRRASQTQYLGGFFEYARITTSQLQATTQTQTLSLFYTLYLGRALTLSVAAGVQHLDFTAPSTSPYKKWTPSVRTNFGWQGGRARLTADYSRDITAGQGLMGAYASDSAGASARWQLTRSWILRSIAVYHNSKNSVPTFAQGYPGGHSVSGTATAEYTLSSHFVAGLGYTRLHQNFTGIAAISRAPNSDRIYLSLSYNFQRPLGR
jgi:hypothetical protein